MTDITIPKMFYLVGYDGKLATNKTYVINYSPSQVVSKVENAFGTIREFTDIYEIVFSRGVYECHDKDIAEYLMVYSTGGEFKGKSIKPNNLGFTVTDKDPMQTVEVREQKVEVIKTQYPRAALAEMTVKGLEAIMIIHNIDLTGITPTKASYIDVLTKNDLVSG
jgi:hypothetical protein